MRNRSIVVVLVLPVSVYSSSQQVTGGRQATRIFIVAAQHSTSTNTLFRVSRRNCRVQFDASLCQLRPRCTEGRVKNYRTRKSRYDFQQLSSIHQIREEGFVSNGKHDQIDVLFFDDPQ